MNQPNVFLKGQKKIGKPRMKRFQSSTDVDKERERLANEYRKKMSELAEVEKKIGDNVPFSNKRIFRVWHSKTSDQITRYNFIIYDAEERRILIERGFDAETATKKCSTHLCSTYEKKIALKLLELLNKIEENIVFEKILKLMTQPQIKEGDNKDEEEL